MQKQNRDPIATDLLDDRHVVHAGKQCSCKNMEALENLLQLPYQTLAILIAGYLSYRLAYTGRDTTHRTLDTLAIALVFALPDGQLAAVALLMPYLLGTALLSWDPLYGLVNWATGRTGKAISQQHPKGQPAIA